MPTPVVFSWSAGKDSAFGLWTLLRDPSYEVRALLTTITDGYDRVSMSGVREELLDQQAIALQLPLIKVRIPPACPNEVYEQLMAATLAANEFDGVDHLAFSDLFLADVRAYREERLGRLGMHGLFPIWGRNTGVLAQEMMAAGFRAIVVCVDPKALDPSFAGREFDGTFCADLPNGVDPCGENGEFHTFVWAAPMYQRPIPCRTGEVVIRDGFVFCDVVPVGSRETALNAEGPGTGSGFGPSRIGW
ncbi:MAG: ATP-binding protein [Candidatus Dormiibacterota bacterium]